MAEIQPETMKGTTLDIAAENRAQLKQLFPTVFTETRNDKGELTESIDFAKLKAELGTCELILFRSSGNLKNTELVLLKGLTSKVSDWPFTGNAIISSIESITE